MTNTPNDGPPFARHWQPHYPGLERLICIALADEQLAARLIADPAAALDAAGQLVALTDDERGLATSVRGALDIHDFAARLHARIRSRHGLP